MAEQCDTHESTKFFIDYKKSFELFGSIVAEKTMHYRR